MSNSPTFAKVYPKLWRDETMINVISKGAEYLSMAFYLRTNKLFNMIGIYYLPIRQIQKDLRIKNESDTKVTLKGLIDVDYCHYDFDSEYVWVVDMAKHQVEKKPNSKQIKGVNNILNRLSEDDAPFVEEFKAKYPEYVILNERKTEGDVLPITKKNTNNWRQEKEFHSAKSSY